MRQMPMRRDGKVLRPLTPLFDPRARRGAIDVGISPPAPPSVVTGGGNVGVSQGGSSIDISAVANGIVILNVTSSVNAHTFVNPGGWDELTQVDSNGMRLTFWSRTKQSGDTVFFFDKTGINNGSSAAWVALTGMSALATGTPGTEGTVGDAPGTAGRNLFVLVAYLNGSTSVPPGSTFSDFPVGTVTHAIGGQSSALAYGIYIVERANNSPTGFTANYNDRVSGRVGVGFSVS